MADNSAHSEWKTEGLVTQPQPAAAASDATAPFGRFAVLGEIARGGMGIVYRAFDPTLERVVAFKVMLDTAAASTEFCRRFLVEARTTGQLQHPGIVPVYELGEFPARDHGPPRHYFAMKLVEGRTLADLLRQRQSPAHELPRFLKIFEQVCQSVAYAHSQRILHRDLKPANVMVGAFGEVQVMDWGLAKSIDVQVVPAEMPTLSGQTENSTALPRHSRPAESLNSQLSSVRDMPTSETVALPAPSATEMTTAGAVLGTVTHMPPEQAAGAHDLVDERADVFALGAVLCEVLTGKAPYTGRTATEVLPKARKGELDEAFARLDASGADAGLITLARKCLSAARDGRPRDGAAVAEAIGAYLTGVQERLHAAEVERARAETKTLEERKRRKVQLALAGSVLALIAIAGGGMWWLQKQSAERERMASAQREEAARRRERAKITIESALVNLRGLQERGLWKQGEVLLNQVEQQTSSDADSADKGLVASARRNLELLTQLDDVRQSKLLPIDGKIAPERAVRRYAKVFERFGFTLLEGDETGWAGKIKASPIRDEIVAALDDWAASAPADVAARLDRIAALATDENWRDRLSKLKHDRGALVEQAKALRRSGGSPALFVRLAEMLGIASPEAIELLDRAAWLHPADVGIHLSRSLHFATVEPRRFDLNIAAERAILALRPESPAVWNSLALTHQVQGDVDAAGEAFRRAIQLGQDDPRAFTNYGLLLSIQGKAKEAIAACRKAVEIDAESGTYQSNLAAVLGQNGELEEAVATGRKAVQLEPNNAHFRTNLGVFLEQLGDDKGAEEHYREGIRAEPGSPTPLYRLGALLRERGNLKEALAYCRKAVEVDPNSDRAHNELGVVLYRMGDNVGAAAAYRRSIQIDGGSATRLVNLALALHKLGDLPGSHSAFAKALKITPEDGQAHAAHVPVLVDMGKFAEAGEAAAAALRFLPKDYSDSVRSSLVATQERCKRLLAIEERWLQIKSGTYVPASTAERYEIALYAGKYRKHYFVSYREYADALASDSTPQMGPRVDASRVAVLAASGTGADGIAVAEEEAHFLLNVALQLRLGVLSEVARASLSQTSPDRARVYSGLRSWELDPNLASVRDPAMLAAMPEQLRHGWQKFWTEVAALRKKAAPLEPRGRIEK